jgi:hypothetical protein
MLIIQNKSNIRLIVKVLVIFNLVANFPHFTNNILMQIPWFKKIKVHKTFAIICHKCLQYEKALKILYFDILSIAKVG